VALGLCAILLAVERFATFDACLENPACDVPSSVSTLESYLAMMVVGVAATVMGVTIALFGLRSGPTEPTSMRTP
jgi:hypothetical protein